MKHLNILTSKLWSDVLSWLGLLNSNISHVTQFIDLVSHGKKNNGASSFDANGLLVDYLVAT